MTLKMCNICGCVVSDPHCLRCGHHNTFKKRTARIYRSESEMKKQFDYRLSTKKDAKAINDFVIECDICVAYFMHRGDWKDKIRGNYFDEFYFDRTMIIGKQDALELSRVLQ